MVSMLCCNTNYGINALLQYQLWYQCFVAKPIMVSTLCFNINYVTNVLWNINDDVNALMQRQFHGVNALLQHQFRRQCSVATPILGFYDVNALLQRRFYGVNALLQRRFYVFMTSMLCCNVEFMASMLCCNADFMFYDLIALLQRRLYGVNALLQRRFYGVNALLQRRFKMRIVTSGMRVFLSTFLHLFILHNYFFLCLLLLCICVKFG